MGKKIVVNIFKDEGGHFRWRRRAGNSQKVAVSGESFYGERETERAVLSEIDNIRNAEVLEVRYLDQDGKVTRKYTKQLDRGTRDV